MGKWLGKIYGIASNIWRQPATRSQITNEKYIPYFSDGAGDNWPIVWHDAIANSPSGASCVSTITDFLEGEDFSDPELGKILVNQKGETFFQVHQKTCKEFAEFEGFYWLLRYNMAGQITEWEVLPFENCRLGAPDDRGYISKIHYNPFFGTDQYSTGNRKVTVCYDVYNPLAVKDQILRDKEKFKGQVFFFGTTNAQSRYYPMPEAFSALEWMKTENKISEFHANSLKGRLLQPFMLAMIGNPDDPIDNPEEGSAKTRGEALDEVVNELQGSGNAQNLWVHWFSNESEIPKAIPLPTNNTGELFVTIDNQATKKITIAWKVPAILANISEGATLGGDGNQVRVAVKLMQQRSVRKQRVLTDSYSKIFKNFYKPYTEEIVITPYNPYPELEVLDQKIWDVMTTEEKRDWIVKNTEVKLLETTQPAPQLPAPPTQARVLNAVPVVFPESVKQKVKKAIEYQEKMGLNCGGKSGKQVSLEIIENKPMGLKQLKRIYSYLKKNERHSDSPFNEGCDVISYNAWGGKEMFDFLDAELKRVDSWLN
ncbi:MAG TPA: hypothetical protein VFZ33_16720 [Chitinophagaceae bacterium]